MVFATPVSWAMIAGRKARRTAPRRQSSASSKELVVQRLGAASTAERSSVAVCDVVRGCCAVSETPAVWCGIECAASARRALIRVT